jgi:hypothetical protein
MLGFRNRNQFPQLSFLQQLFSNHYALKQNTVLELIFSPNKTDAFRLYSYVTYSSLGNRLLRPHYLLRLPFAILFLLPSSF